MDSATPFVSHCDFNIHKLPSNILASQCLDPSAPNRISLLFTSTVLLNLHSVIFIYTLLSYFPKLVPIYWLSYFLSFYCLYPPPSISLLSSLSSTDSMVQNYNDSLTKILSSYWTRKTLTLVKLNQFLTWYNWSKQLKPLDKFHVCTEHKCIHYKFVFILTGIWQCSSISTFLRQLVNRQLVKTLLSLNL